MRFAAVPFAVAFCVSALAGDAGTAMPTVPTLPDGRFGYEEVVQVEGAAAAELQSRARAWLAHAYASAPAVIQVDDPNAGQIIAKGAFAISFMYLSIPGRHTLTIQVKDGRYRYLLTDFFFDWEKRKGVPLETYHGASEAGTAKMRGRVAAASIAMIESLKAAMLVPTPANSNW